MKFLYFFLTSVVCASGYSSNVMGTNAEYFSKFANHEDRSMYGYGNSSRTTVHCADQFLNSSLKIKSATLDSSEPSSESKVVIKLEGTDTRIDLYTGSMQNSLALIQVIEKDTSNKITLNIKNLNYVGIQMGFEVEKNPLEQVPTQVPMLSTCESSEFIVIDNE